MQYGNSANIVLVNWVSTERTFFPRIFAFECEVLEQTWPAVKVATLCYSRCRHQRSGLHADRTLRFFSRRCHIRDVEQFNHIFPVDKLAWIAEILDVGALGVSGAFCQRRSQNKRKSSLHVLIFVEARHKLPVSAPLRLCDRLQLLLTVRETKQVAEVTLLVVL